MIRQTRRGDPISPATTGSLDATHGRASKLDGVHLGCDPALGSEWRNAACRWRDEIPPGRSPLQELVHMPPGLIRRGLRWHEAVGRADVPAMDRLESLSGRTDPGRDVAGPSGPTRNTRK
jgi:hypothetical protein